MDFYEDPGTGWREWEDERDLTAEDLDALAEDKRDAEEAEVWEAAYGTDDERYAAMEER